MEEAILNSLLRYSKQVTPVRDTYPIPSGGWLGSLRRSNPPVNLSTYYLLDQPSLSKSPSKRVAKPAKPGNAGNPLRLNRPTSSSSLHNSPTKRSTKPSPAKKASCIGSTEPSRKITEPDSEIKAIVEREQKERAKISRQFRSYDSLDHLVSHEVSQESSVMQEHDSIISSLRDEIDKLKQELEVTRGNLSLLEPVNK